MAKKEYNSEVNGIDVEDYVVKAKALRMQMALDANKKDKDLVEVREEFRRFFIKLQHEKNLDKTLENIIWKHLIAVDCAKSDKFTDGILSFGIK